MRAARAEREAEQPDGSRTSWTQRDDDRRRRAAGRSSVAAAGGPSRGGVERWRGRPSSADRLTALRSPPVIAARRSRPARRSCTGRGRSMAATARPSRYDDPVRRRHRRRASAAAPCCGLLPALRERYAPTFVVVNGENAAGGLGITPKIADELFAAGVDVITLGNHAYHHREVYPYLDARAAHPAPGQLPAAASPATGTAWSSATALRLGVVNLSGNLFLARRPLGVRRGRLGRSRTSRGKVDHVLVDMHAEATSEKVAHGLAPRRPRHRRRRHPHPRPDRRRPRAARRHRLHHRRRA